MTTKIVLRKVILSPKMLGKTQYQGEDSGNNAQIVMFHTWEYVCVHGASNQVILPRIVWHILQILACKLDFPRKRK